MTGLLFFNALKSEYLHISQNPLDCERLCRKYISDFFLSVAPRGYDYDNQTAANVNEILIVM